jgi:hypothetical protein
MPNSYNTITLQGLGYSTGLNGWDQKVFGPFDFDYISKDDIKLIFKESGEYQSIAIDSVDPVTKLVTIVDDNLPFTMSPAVVPGGTEITSGTARIYRSTSLSPIVDFQSGSRISESDLDTAYRQALFASQEAVEDASASGTRTLQATDDIVDGAVTALKLASNAVENAKILNGAVTAGKLAADAVETAKIKDLSVNSDKLAADAVETDKIDDGAVTAPKLASTLDLSSKTLTFPASSLAEKADMQGEASNGKTCVASTLKHHPGVAKAYGRIVLAGTTGGTTALVTGDYNVTSVAPSAYSDPVDGDPDFTRVTLSNAMADKNYVVTATEEQLASATDEYGTAAYGVTVNIISTTQFDIGTNVDGASIAFVVHGKLA